MKVAVITGCSSGIGAACCNKFSAENYQIIGIDVQKPTNPTASLESPMQFYCTDLSKIANIDAFLAEVSKTTDHVDVLVNAAGINLVKQFQEMTEYDFDHVLAVNTKAPFFLAQKLLPLMTKGHYSSRSIVNITSVHSTATIPHMATYTASKGALSALTRTLALELASHKIRVNAIQPGFIDTPMLRSSFELDRSASGESIDEILAKIANSTPAGRIGLAKDIANAAFFLADEENSFITGESLVVDGGILARLSTK